MLVPPAGKTDKKRLDNYQRHCLRLIYHVNYTSRLDMAGPVNVSKQLENQCRRYTKRIYTDTFHSLHDYIKTGDRFSLFIIFVINIPIDHRLAVSF